MLLKLLLSFLAISLASASSVIIADDSNFDDIISKPNTYSFVKFYADWCGHCKNMAPVWEELAESLSGNNKVQIVKINADVNRAVGERYGIEGYPTLKMFNPGDPRPNEYQGGRDLSQLAEFVGYAVGFKGLGNSKPVENHVVSLDDSTWKEKLKGKHGFFTITASWCGYCKKLKPVWKELAGVFKNDQDTVVIGDVLTTDVQGEALVEKFGVETFPTLVYLSPKNPDGVTFEKYTKGRSLEELVEFVNLKTSIDRNIDGTLGERAGVIEFLEGDIKKIASKSDAEKVLQMLNKDKGSDFFWKYYKKLVEKYINGEIGYFKKETSRLQGLLKNEGIKENLKENITKRINILKGFLGKQQLRDEL